MAVWVNAVFFLQLEYTAKPSGKSPLINSKTNLFALKNILLLPLSLK